VRFVGGYEQAPLLYEDMLAWMDSAGARIAGPIRESYVRFGADQQGYTLPPHLLASDVRKYRTEIQIPITTV
jgi:effector-binding domain-containing protein